MCSSRRRGRRCRSSTDSSVVDRAATSPSRARHALEGAHTGSSSWDFARSLRPGASRSSARVELGQSGACLRPPRPSGVAVVDSSSTFAGFRLAWGGLGGVSVAYGLFSSGGKFAGSPRLGVLVRSLPPASGRSFIGAPQRGSCLWVDCCLACPRACVLAVFRTVAGCPAGIDGRRFSSPSGGEVGSFSYTLAFSRPTSVLSRCQILAWLVSWGRWLVLGWCLCLA